MEPIDSARQIAAFLRFLQAVLFFAVRYRRRGGFCDGIFAGRKLMDICVYTITDTYLDTNIGDRTFADYSVDTNVLYMNQDIDPVLGRYLQEHKHVYRHCIVEHNAGRMDLAFVNLRLIDMLRNGGFGAVL